MRKNSIQKPSRQIREKEALPPRVSDSNWRNPRSSEPASRTFAREFVFTSRYANDRCGCPAGLFDSPRLNNVSSSRVCAAFLLRRSSVCACGRCSTFTSSATGAVTIKSQENVALVTCSSSSDVTLVLLGGDKFYLRNSLDKN